jgi:hypothetical protein
MDLRVAHLTWKRSVPPAVAGGSAFQVQNAISNPVATAPGTDLLQVQRMTPEIKQLRVQFGLKKTKLYALGTTVL